MNLRSTTSWPRQPHHLTPSDKTRAKTTMSLRWCLRATKHMKAMSHLRPCFTINKKEHVEVPPRAHSRHLKTLPGKGSRPAQQLTCPDCNLKARGTLGKDQCRPAGSTLIAIAKQSSRMAIKRRLLGNWNLDALAFSRWHANNFPICSWLPIVATDCANNLNKIKAMKTTFLVTDLGATQIAAPAPTRRCFFQFHWRSLA